MSTSSLKQRLFIRPTLQDLHAWKDEVDIQPSVQVDADKELLIDTNNNKTQFKKHFGLLSLIIFSICSVVGNGIYVLAGTAGKSYAGTSLTIALIVASIIDGGVCLSFVEYASRYNVIGSNYIYTYITSGEILGYLIGFSEFICSTISPSISAIAIVAYFQTFLDSVGLDTSDNIFFGKDMDIFTIHCSFNLGAVIVIIFLGIITLFNVKCGSSIINIGATFNVILILVCTFGGIPYINNNNWFHPCNESVENKFNTKCPSDATNSWMPYGINGMIAASGLCVWSIDGSWYCVTVAEEAKNPKRDIPRAIVICLIIVVFLFLGLTVVISGIVPFQALNENSCVADAFKQNHSIWLQRIAALGASSNMTISALGYTVAAPRMAWRFAKDGFICNCFTYLSPKTQIPTFGTIVFMLVGIFLAGFVDLTNILSFGIVMICFWYSAISCGLLVLRFCPPDLHLHILSKNIKEDMVENEVKELTQQYPAVIGDELYITEIWNESRIFNVIWGYFLISMILSYILVNRPYFVDNNTLLIIWWILVILLTLLLLFAMCCMVYFNYKFEWKSWIEELNKDHEIVLMPLVPLSSFIIIFVLSYMSATFGLLLLLECIACFTIGFMFYFCYGYRKSALWSRHSLR